MRRLLDAAFDKGSVFEMGRLWGRAQDRLGMAYMNNRLSNDRRRFLEAGGMSYFIGDGAGNFRYGAEHGSEVFYSVGLGKNLWVTGDWQHIANPAYNTLRGPVNVYAIRLHAEF